jgi:hypothetical protein
MGERKGVKRSPANNQAVRMFWGTKSYLHSTELPPLVRDALIRVLKNHRNHDSQTR